jgi:hypothetical protein
VDAPDLSLTDGAAAGDWIEPRLGGEFGAVSLQVPKGFEAYARVFHPFRKGLDRKRTRWAEVAADCGTVAHREMQWDAISRRTHSGEADQDPWTGEMDRDDLSVVCEILEAHSADLAHCFFGLCTIESWEDSFSAAELRAHPFLKHPMGRDYIVLEGPITAVGQIEGGRAPNLIWPADRSWLVASEVDFDSTLIGGSRDLIDAIVSSPVLEAWEVEPDTSLAIDADKINLIPAPTIVTAPDQGDQAVVIKAAEIHLDAVVIDYTSRLPWEEEGPGLWGPPERFELNDDLGTRYQWVGWVLYEERPPPRMKSSFRPAAPAEAKYLQVDLPDRSVRLPVST